MTDDQELMRDAVVVQFDTGDTGAKNAVFALTIPEKYAMVLHKVDFGKYVGSPDPLPNQINYFLVDDSDETDNPGHTAQKVIQSDCLIVNGAILAGFAIANTFVTKNCHLTMVVKNPNFIVDVTINPEATIRFYCRIWFDFVKISDAKILELIRQQQY